MGAAARGADFAARWIAGTLRLSAPVAEEN